MEDERNREECPSIDSDTTSDSEESVFERVEKGMSGEYDDTMEDIGYEGNDRPSIEELDSAIDFDREMTDRGRRYIENEVEEIRRQVRRNRDQTESNRELIERLVEEVEEQREINRILEQNLRMAHRSRQVLKDAARRDIRMLE